MSRGFLLPSCLVTCWGKVLRDHTDAFKVATVAIDPCVHLGDRPPRQPQPD
jgi:hypothetical protein